MGIVDDMRQKRNDKEQKTTKNLQLIDIFALRGKK